MMKYRSYIKPLDFLCKTMIDVTIQLFRAGKHRSRPRNFNVPEALQLPLINKFPRVFRYLWLALREFALRTGAKV